MASSRLQKIGTIYTRITGLMRAGALKYEDKPVWYEVYEAFPPKNVPTISSNDSLTNILYPEDAIRAKFQKLQSANDAVNLTDSTLRTKSQRFIAAYKALEEEGNLSSKEQFTAALEKFQHTDESITKFRRPTETSLASSFKNAQRSKTEIDQTPSKIDVQSMFKND